MKSKLITVFILALAASFALVPVMGESVSDTVWTLENATEAFAPQIIVPENAAQYKKELTAQLTDEQAEAFQEGMAFVFVPNVSSGDEEIAIQGICYLPVELTDDHQLKADFSGLYVSVEEEASEILQAQLVTTRPILMARQDSLDDAKATFSLKGVFYGELDVAYNPFIIGLDYAGNTAQIESIALSESDKEPLDGYYSAYRYTYVMDEGTELPHFLNMTATSWTLWYEKKINESRTIRLYPVSGAGCQVLFSITNKDGTGYSLPPVNYD